MADEVSPEVGSPTHAQARSAYPIRLAERRRVLLAELKDRSTWFIRIRWLLAVVIGVGLLVALPLEIRLPQRWLALLALFMLGYNLLFREWYHRLKDLPLAELEPRLRRFARWQVGLDFLALFLFVHLTGGASSPFLFFFIFHIILASILLQWKVALRFAFLVVVGVGLLIISEYRGWLPHHPLICRGNALELANQPLPLLVEWAFFALTVLVSTVMMTHIRVMLRRRIHDLAMLSEDVLNLNEKLATLHDIGESLISQHGLAEVLAAICRRLTELMNVQGVSVKLLSADGRYLEYVGAHGLPPHLTEHKIVEVERSPLNRRIIGGEPYVTGSATQQELFQLGEELSAAHIQSVLFVPLQIDVRVIGILGAYGAEADRFNAADVDFLRLSAKFVAIAIENARVYDALERMSTDRERFTLRLAHNLRSPLSAMLSILEVVRDGYIGHLNDYQRDYLQRVDKRAHAMIDLINELMNLAEKRRQSHSPVCVELDFEELAARLKRTFQDRAAQKQIGLRLQVEEDLPTILGDKEMIEGALENLIANSIKYTPSGGTIEVAIIPADGAVLIRVSDTGIGIPEDAMPNLFSEFFRAPNAKSFEETGTGLGLTYVKEVVEQHGGHVSVESKENYGTRFEVRLPAAAAIMRESVAPGTNGR